MKLIIQLLIVLPPFFGLSCSHKPKTPSEIDPRPITEIILALNSHLKYVDSIDTHICNFVPEYARTEPDSLMLQLLTPNQKNSLLRCLKNKNTDIINLSRGPLPKEAYKNLKTLTARIDTKKLTLEVGFIKPQCTLCSFLQSHFYKLEKTAPNFYKAEFIPESDRWQ